MSTKSSKALILSRINQGEGTQLDFKHSISSPEKIAISISAFANTNGGSLLVGVKDNGRICGANVSEELYVLEKALSELVFPTPKHQFIQWTVDGKQVLELEIAKWKDKPYMVMDSAGKTWGYIRQHDENIAVNGVWVKVQKKLKDGVPSFTHIGESERILLKFLEENERATLSKFCKLASISHFEATDYLVNLVCLKIIDLHITKQSNYYTLHE